MDETIAVVREGDELASGRLVEPHGRELRVHCDRLLGSFDEAEDLLQDTLMRARRRRSGLR